MCGKGPFKESEKSYRYISLNNKDGSNYCIACFKTLGLPLTDVIDKSLAAANEMVEVVSFENNDLPIVSEDPLIEDTKFLEPEEKFVPPPPKKVKEVEPGPFFVYMGQFVDNAFLTGVTKDIKKDLERINSGCNPKLNKLPLEIVYYHIEDTKEGAIASKEAIMSMNNPQKELLVEKFVTEFFKK
jgi:predicted GIY-YIG superfamily endonuclease